jgi:hypothetical protein
MALIPTTNASGLSQSLSPQALGTLGNSQIYDLFGNSKVGGYLEPDNGNRTEHPTLGQIILNNGQIRELEIYHIFVNGLQKNVELPDLYKWQVHDLFPLTNGLLRRTSTQLIFDQAMLDDVPPEGVVRMISSTETKKTRGSERKGLGMMLENDHMNSPEGITFFFASLKTIIQAVLNSLATDVIKELMLCKKAEEAERSRQSTFPINYTKLLQEEISRYGAISHGSMRLSCMIEDAKKNMRIVPDTLVCPSGGTLFLNYTAPAHSDAYRNIAEAIGGKHTFMSPTPTSYPSGKPITTINGLQVFENEVTMPAPNPNSGVASNYQLMNRLTSVGEYYPMTGCHTAKETLSDFSSSSRDIAVYNENNDSFDKIYFVEALNKCHVFTDEGYEDEIHDLCDTYNQKPDIKFFKTVQSKNIDNVQEEDLIPDLEDRPFMLATFDRNSVWKPARYFGELGSYAITQQHIKATSTTVMNTFKMPLETMNRHLSTLKYYIKRLDDFPLATNQLDILLDLHLYRASVDPSEKMEFKVQFDYQLVTIPPIFFNTVSAFDYYVSHRTEFKNLYDGTRGGTDSSGKTTPAYNVHSLWRTLDENVESWKDCLYQLSLCISNVLPESELISTLSSPVYSEPDIVNSLFFCSVLGHRAPIYASDESSVSTEIKWKSGGTTKRVADARLISGEAPFDILLAEMINKQILDKDGASFTALCLAILSSTDPSKSISGLTSLLTREDQASKKVLVSLKNELLSAHPKFEIISILASQSDEVIKPPASGAANKITEVSIKEGDNANTGQLFVTQLLLSDAVSKVIDGVSIIGKLAIGDPATRFKTPTDFSDIKNDRFKPYRVNIQSGIHSFGKFTENLSGTKKADSTNIGKRSSQGLFESYGSISSQKRLRISDTKRGLILSERAAIDNEMFDWRWRQTYNLSNHVLAICMQAVLTTAINKKTFTFMADNDIFIPLGVNLWRLGISHEMGTFTVMKRGAETGISIFCNAHWGWSFNNGVKNYLGSLTLWTAVDVLKPENISHLHDIWFQGYTGGHNTRWITGQSDLRDFGLDRPSLIATLVPLHEKLDKPLSFSGLPPAELNMNLDNPKDFMWSGWKYYENVYKIGEVVTESRPNPNTNFYEMSDRFNDIACLGFHLKFNPNTKLFDIPVESRGHLKPGGVYQGAAKVMAGRDCYFQPVHVANYRIC